MSEWLNVKSDDNVFLSDDGLNVEILFETNDFGNRWLEIPVETIIKKLPALAADSKALKAVEKFITRLRKEQDDEYDLWAQCFENVIKLAVNEQSQKPRCICVDFLNCNPDPVPNPDCPIHGAGFKPLG